MVFAWLGTELTYCEGVSMQYLKLNKHKSCSRASSIGVKPLIRRRNLYCILFGAPYKLLLFLK